MVGVVVGPMMVNVTRAKPSSLTEREGDLHGSSQNGPTQPQQIQRRQQARMSWADNGAWCRHRMQGMPGRPLPGAGMGPGGPEEVVAGFPFRVDPGVRDRPTDS